jgi:predicted dehydrogenase
VLTAAVVGLGNIGQEHVRALARTPGARLAGLCDRSAAIGRALGERYGVDGVHSDLSEMLTSVRPDVVHIATPPSVHVSMVRECLAAGAHVLVEKPLAADEAELGPLLADAERRGLHVVENYNYLWNRQILQLRQWLRDGQLGDVLHVDAEVALDVLGSDSPFVTGNGSPFALGLRGGLVADFLPHLASIVHALLGPHVSASGVWSKRSESLLPADEFRALVTHGTGTSAVGFTAHAQPGGFRLTVVGTRMRVRAELYGTLLAVEAARAAPGPLVPVLNGLSVSRSEVAGALGGLRRKLDGGPATLEGLWGLIETMYDNFDRGQPPPITHQEVLAVNRLTADLTASAP